MTFVALAIPGVHSFHIHAEASDKMIAEETLRRGVRFMNIERSKAVDAPWDCSWYVDVFRSR